MSVFTLGKLIISSVFIMPVYIFETILFEGWDFAVWILKQSKRKILKVVSSTKKNFTT
jgi:hypothetical protein